MKILILDQLKGAYALVVAIAIWMLTFGVDPFFTALMSFVVMAIAVQTFSVWDEKRQQQQRIAEKEAERKAREEVHSRIGETILEKLPDLGGEYNSAIALAEHLEDGGERWLEKMHAFIEDVMGFQIVQDSAVAQQGGVEVEVSLEYLIQRIDTHTRHHLKKRRLDGFSTEMVQQEYVDYVVGLLRPLGWRAVRHEVETSGMDLQAGKRDTEVAIACIQQDTWVDEEGIMAIVEEMHAAGLERAVIISSAEFTTPARQLAQEHSLLLLHHGDVEALDQLL